MGRRETKIKANVEVEMKWDENIFFNVRKMVNSGK